MVKHGSSTGNRLYYLFVYVFLFRTELEFDQLGMLRREHDERFAIHLHILRAAEKACLENTLQPIHGKLRYTRCQ